MWMNERYGVHGRGNSGVGSGRIEAFWWCRLEQERLQMILLMEVEVSVRLGQEIKKDNIGDEYHWRFEDEKI